MRTKESENLVRVKFALADKYERKARVCKSKPLKAVYFRRAEHHRKQADNAERSITS